MAVQTFEAITDSNGGIRLIGPVRLPADTKVYVVVPEQTTPFAAIVPEASASPDPAVRFPLARVMDEGLARRLVKTLVEDARAEV